MPDRDANNEDLTRLPAPAPAPGPGDPPDRSGPRRDSARWLVIVRYLDVVLVAGAVPVALALGAPAFGCAVGAVAWVAQRVLAQTDRRWIARASQPRAQLGLNLAEAFGRIWLLAGAIVLAGVAGGRADGLAAALVIFGAYSVALAIRVLSGPPNRQTSSPPAYPTRTPPSASPSIARSPSTQAQKAAGSMTHGATQ